MTKPRNKGTKEEKEDAVIRMVVYFKQLGQFVQLVSVFLKLHIILSPSKGKILMRNLPFAINPLSIEFNSE